MCHTAVVASTWEGLKNSSSLLTLTMLVLRGLVTCTTVFLGIVLYCNYNMGHDHRGPGCPVLGCVSRQIASAVLLCSLQFHNRLAVCAEHHAVIMFYTKKALASSTA